MKMNLQDQILENNFKQKKKNARQDQKREKIMKSH